MNGQYLIALSDETQIGQARRTAAGVALQTGLGESERAKASIIASELATNVVRHAKAGEILVRSGIRGAEKAVEIIALDRGAGMSDVQRCLSGGYSTGGSLGHGLGAVRRLSTDFDVYSLPGLGTAVFSRVASEDCESQHKQSPCEGSAISIPAPGETECGDSWGVASAHRTIWAVVVDGLGHGPVAATAAAEAMRVFDQASFASPAAFLEKAHESMRSTRGAAAAVARIDLERRILVYAGVGNISAHIVASGTKVRSLPSHNGTIGVQVRKLQEFEYPWPGNALLIMHSDGLLTRWDLAHYPGLLGCRTALIAAVLYRDFKRGRDDATILVVRVI